MVRGFPTTARRRTITSKRPSCRGGLGDAIGPQRFYTLKKVWDTADRCARFERKCLVSAAPSGSSLAYRNGDKRERFPAAALAGSVIGLHAGQLLSTPLS
jgi:hypothetical protein